MTIDIKVTGRDNLTSGPDGSLSGELKVKLSGGGASRTVSLTVPIVDAGDFKIAEDRALRVVDEYAKTLRARGSEERARIANP